MYEKLSEISGIKPYQTEVNFICTKIDDELVSKGLNVKKLREKMLEKGMISAGEYDRIMAENRRVFSPYLADLYPDNALL